MSETTKKLKKLDKKLNRKLQKLFGPMTLDFFGDMHKGHLTLVITGHEK